MENQHSTNQAEQWLRECKKDVELDYFHGQSIKKDAETDPLKLIIADDILNLLEDLKNAVIKSTSPEEVFKTAFKGLNQLEQKQFVIDNLMEGIKRGEKPSILLKRYEQIGIFQVGEVHRESLQDQRGPGAKLQEMNSRDNDSFEQQAKEMGSFIYKCKQVLKRSALTFCSLACAAMKNIPSYIKFEPTIKLGPGLSSISIGLSSDADFTLQDFIDAVKMAWWEAGLK